jgi:Capsule assembly protein Wzi
MRVVSPIKALPLALYVQLIGEDGSALGVPQKYLGLLGAETWYLTDSGAAWRGRFEYASTSCKWDRPKLLPNCGYRQGIFQAGYRYHSRVIGHTTDSDSQSFSVSLGLTQRSGTRWNAKVVHAKLDRYGGVDVYNPLTRGPSDYDSGEMSWDGKLLGQDVGLQLGFEHQSPATGSSSSGAFGFVQWRKAL